MRRSVAPLVVVVLLLATPAAAHIKGENALTPPCSPPSENANLSVFNDGEFLYSFGPIRVVNFFWQNGWNSKPFSAGGNLNSHYIDDAVQTLVTQSPFFLHLCQYGVPPIHWEKGLDTSGFNICPDKDPPTSSPVATDMESILTCMEAAPETGMPLAGGFPSFTLPGAASVCGFCGATFPCFSDPACRALPNPTGNLYVNIFLPRGVFPVGSGCNPYHFQVPSWMAGWPFFPVAGTQARPIYYAVFPTDPSCVFAEPQPIDPTGLPGSYPEEIRTIDRIAAEVSHEMSEFLTDEMPGAFWRTAFDNAFVATDGEIADICEHVVESCDPSTGAMYADICALNVRNAVTNPVGFQVSECSATAPACVDGADWVHLTDGSRILERGRGDRIWYDRDHQRDPANPDANKHHMQLVPYWSNKDNACIAPGEAQIPLVSVSVSPKPNTAGWNNSPVTVTISGTDYSATGINQLVYSINGHSTTVNSGTASFTYSVEGISTLHVQATDNSGLSSVDFVQTISINTVPPTIAAIETPVPNQYGWDNTDVTVSFDCTSPVVVFCPAPTTVSAEGANQQISGTARDIADNTASTSATVSLDKTPPTIIASANPPPNNYGWNNTSVTVSFACSDSLSLVLSCPQSATFTTEGASQIAQGTAEDHAFNTNSTSDAVNIDETPPVVLYSGAAAIYTVDQNVSIACSATDALSGIATQSCQNISGPAYLFTIGTNTYSASAMDKAGNQTSVSVTFTVIVTFQSMRNLVDRFVTKPGVANALKSKLDSAEAASNRGDANTKSNMLGAFDNQLSAQTDKAISAADAAILERLVPYL